MRVKEPFNSWPVRPACNPGRDLHDAVAGISGARGGGRDRRRSLPPEAHPPESPIAAARWIELAEAEEGRRVDFEFGSTRPVLQCRFKALSGGRFSRRHAEDLVIQNVQSQFFPHKALLSASIPCLPRKWAFDGPVPTAKPANMTLIRTSAHQQRDWQGRPAALGFGEASSSCYSVGIACERHETRPCGSRPATQ